MTGVQTCALQISARIGKKYKNRVVDSQALSDHQKYIDLAYSWYVIAKAAFKGLCSSQSYRTYEYYKGFFAAHRIGHECFQHILQNDMGEWDEGSEHFPYFEQINNYYDELYERYGVDSELDRADTDANEEISRLRSGI